MELGVCVFAKKVFDSVVVCVEEEACELVVVARWTLEFFVVAGAADGGAGFGCARWTWVAGRDPWEAE